MNSVSMPSLPLAPASSASSAMSVLLARSLTIPATLADLSGRSVTKRLLAATLALDLVEVEHAQQPDGARADDHDERVRDAGDARVQRERQDRHYRHDAQSHVEAVAPGVLLDRGHDASTVGSRRRRSASKRATSSSSDGSSPGAARPTETASSARTACGVVSSRSAPRTT